MSATEPPSVRTGAAAESRTTDNSGQSVHPIFVSTSGPCTYSLLTSAAQTQIAGSRPGPTPSMSLARCRINCSRVGDHQPA
jgi:hypothetical protein